MNKQIVFSLISIFLLLVLIGGGTYAYFTNVAASTNNVFSSGTLDLKLSASDESFTDNLTATFSGPALSPGSCLPASTMLLKNTGSIAGNHIDISVTNTNSSFASFLRLETFTFGETDIIVTDSNSNGFVDLQDLEVDGLINQPFTDFEAHPLVMEVCLDASAGNDQQGQTNTLDFTILLDQGPHI